MVRNRKAQAVLELAILGAVIITAFAILISYSERYNREQSYMQQTFRAALKKAKEINNSVNWDARDFRRMPNVTNPMEIGELQQFASSNSVLWSDGKLTDADKPKAYFELNRNKIVEVPISPDLHYNETVSSSSSYTSALSSSTDFYKNESGGNITTTKTLNATDTISGSAASGGTNVSVGSTLGSGGKYTGGGLSRSGSMQ